MTDRRLTPSNGRVAHVSLRGKVLAKRYTEGDLARIAVPVADLLSEPDGRRDRQLLMGDHVSVLEIHDDFAFLQSAKDGYCGYVAASALGAPLPVTHWVSAAATHLYPQPDLKTGEIARISLGSHLSLVPEPHGRFLTTLDGLFVPQAHVRPVGHFGEEPADVAERLIGTPYLWGGNSRDGIDCSGLVQISLNCSGLPCPGDTDLQEAALGRTLGPGKPYRRNDLFFWQGHVAIAVDATRLIHANGHSMSVAREGIAEAIARIEAAGEGPLRMVKRL